MTRAVLSQQSTNTDIAWEPQLTWRDNGPSAQIYADVTASARTPMENCNRDARWRGGGDALTQSVTRARRQQAKTREGRLAAAVQSTPATRDPKEGQMWSNGRPDGRAVKARRRRQAKTDARL